MASVNRVILIGNLGADPELRHTQSGKAVCTFNIATTEYSGSGQDRKENTEWHKCVAWEKTAENCAKYLAKGRSVYIDGRLTTRSWEDKDKVKRYTTEVIANHVQFLGGPKDAQPSQESRPAGNGQRQQQQGQGYGDDTGFGGSSTPGLDDIPFMRRLDEA